MTMNNRATAHAFSSSDYTVWRQKGEGLLDAKKRWERETGRRGWCVIR